MKKIYSLLLGAAILNHSNAQTIKASIGPGTQANRVKIYLMPDVTQMSSISTLQFNVGVLATGITTAPTATVISPNASITTSWTVSPSYNEGGYWNYNIYTTVSPLTPSFTANTEVEAMEVEFGGGIPNTGTVGLVTLPDGGATTANALFLCTGSINSNGLSNLYYTRTGVTVDNQNSYDPAFVQPGTGTSIATIPNVVLPVRFLNFTATKNGNTAALNWAVENEDANTAYYEIMKSVNSVEFTKLASVPALNNGRTSNLYSFNVDKLSSIRSSGLVYFRIKQVDKDGRFVYTDIKNVRVNGKNIAVYPNPVKTTANVTFELDENAEATISIIDAAGKQVSATQTQGFKGDNLKNLDMSKLPSGNYTIKVQTANEAKVAPVVKAQN